jgi:hypothetical protein
MIADSEITIDIAVTNISPHEIHLPVDKSLKAELNGYTVSVISGANI